MDADAARRGRGGQKPAARRDRAVRMTRAGAQGDAAGTARAGSLPISAFPAGRRKKPAGAGRRGTQNRRQAGISRAGDAGGGAHETRTDKTRRRAARRVTRRTKPAARRVRPRGGRGRALYPCQYPPFPRRTGKTRGGRRAGIGLRWKCGCVRRVTRRARHALALCQYPPFPRRTDKTRGTEG